MGYFVGTKEDQKSVGTYLVETGEVSGKSDVETLISDTAYLNFAIAEQSGLAVLKMAQGYSDIYSDTTYVSSLGKYKFDETNTLLKNAEQYTTPIGSTYNSKVLNVTAQITTVSGVIMDSSGTLLLITDENNIYEYAMSTPWDITTATYQSRSYNTQGDGSTQLYGGMFSPDGTKLFIVERNYRYVMEYDWNTNLSDISYVRTLNVSSQLNYVDSIIFNRDGTKLYGKDRYQKVVRYNLPTPYSLAGATFDTGQSLDLTTLAAGHSSGNGPIMISEDNDVLWSYDVDDGWYGFDMVDGDITTLSYDGTKNHLKAAIGTSESWYTAAIDPTYNAPVMIFSGTANENLYSVDLVGGTVPLEIISETQTALTQPDTAYIVIDTVNDSHVINTSLNAYASRDGGTTWVKATLKQGTSVGTHKLYFGSIDLSSAPSGTSMVYKVETTDTVGVEIHAASLQWR